MTTAEPALELGRDAILAHRRRVLDLERGLPQAGRSGFVQGAEFGERAAELGGVFRTQLGGNLRPSSAGGGAIFG